MLFGQAAVWHATCDPCKAMGLRRGRVGSSFVRAEIGKLLSDPPNSPIVGLGAQPVYRATREHERMARPDEVLLSLAKLSK